ncbi:T9SS type A sorting domain-containing protein [Wenyingzhuangia sp. 2_MG-2023]|uniref:T9SS type A sorting domain-containing protein n=1 Tax=Wenyingzhuangia sp. 2_MG-2023 TaxID=3062639 RepID=UPI0026E1ED3F|nr:T9SS type A sorting domain-containing protein [Wenyingzhuangia sp. 2_MG-2023]MDO6737049.1 T9SS type A sorting domain-containing protein [Wenyingzhuangia sp. 2_MG-2023]
MKKQILKISALFLMTVGANAQILNADAFGFELTNVDYSGSTSDIVTAWTQVAGFSQSSDEAHSGTYSMKAEFDYSDGDPTAAKLQTWRSNTNKEGNFSLTERDYLVSAWIKVTSGTQPSVLNLPIKGAGVNIDVSGVSTNVWTKVYKVVTTTADSALGDDKNWMTINFQGTVPATGTSTVYVDDISIVEYNGIQSYTTEEYLGFEGADAEVDGIIEPLANGNSGATGWFLQNNTYFSFSDEQANSGDHSVKFDSSDGAAEKQIQGGYNTTPGTSLVSFAAGDYAIQANIYIPSGKSVPSKLSLNIKENSDSSPVTSFMAMSIDIDPGLAKDTWHTITSDVATFGQTTDAGYTLKVKADDANTVVYIDDLKWVDGVTLSTKTSKIEGASVKTENGTISVSGANLDSVYSITGQQVSVDGLSSGIYIVKISKGSKQDIIKIVM